MTMPPARHAALLCAAALACAGAPPAPSSRPAACPAVEPPRVLVLTALEPELEALRARASIAEVRVVNGRSVHLGRLAGQPVALAMSGMSPLNAATTAEALLSRFAIRAVVVSGIGGGVNPDLHVGDVVVPARWGNYQEAVAARERAGRFDPAPFPADLGHFGMMFTQPTSVVAPGAPTDQATARFWFPADPAALALARGVADRVQLARCTPGGACLGRAPRIVVGGSGVTGSTFVDNAAYRGWVWDAFHADVLDMESAAIATVAFVHGTPFVAFRSLSDLAGGGEGENELPTFFQLAAGNSAAVVAAYLAALPPDAAPR